MLANRLPSNVHLIVASRDRFLPAADTVRLGAKVYQIGTEQLRLNHTELAVYISRCGTELSEIRCVDVFVGQDQVGGTETDFLRKCRKIAVFRNRRHDLGTGSEVTNISIINRTTKGVKVGLDCANGSSWNIAKSVFDALGADTYVINAQPNGTNINNNAGSTHIEGLQRFVVEKGLDIGFAYDGDADRCLCVDEEGNVITGDHILYIYGCYMKERGKLLTNTVVTTVMSNFGLYKAFDEKGIGYAKTAVGDKYVYEYMAKNGCRIGGEQSGHIIFSKYASTGDGILTSLKMMEVMLAKKKPMSELAAPLKIYPLSYSSHKYTGYGRQ